MAISNEYEKLNESNAKLDYAINHIETSKNLILQALDSLNTSDFDHYTELLVNSANEYVNQVKFVKNQLSKIQQNYESAVYASPDILSGKNDINWR